MCALQRSSHVETVREVKRSVEHEHLVQHIDISDFPLFGPVVHSAETDPLEGQELDGTEYEDDLSRTNGPDQLSLCGNDEVWA